MKNKTLTKAEGQEVRQYDSTDEMLFHTYLLELEQIKVVEILDVETFEIFAGFSCLPKMKAKHYTPDFKFRILDRDFANATKDFFIESDGIVYVDTKGEYTKNLSSSVTFPDRQAMMWDKHSIYVNRVIPVTMKTAKGLFNRTFVPKALIPHFTYKVGVNKGKSKLNFLKLNYEEFMEDYHKRDTEVKPRKQRK